MEFIESPSFTKYVDSYLTNEDYRALQLFLAMDPKRGVVIRASGGLRKLRWAASGRGKRGGVRVIYYYKDQDSQIWLLSIFAKNEQSDLSHTALKAIKELIHE